MPNNVKKIGVKQSDGTYISEDIGVDYSNVDGLDTEAVAFKAKKDLKGNDITEFFRDGSLSGSSLVLTRGSGENPKSIAMGMQGATSGANGSAGLVPAPAIGDQVKFLRGDGTWQTSFSGNYNDLTNKPIADGVGTAKIKGNASAMEVISDFQFRDSMISTTNLTPGTSTLAPGAVYFHYTT